MLLVFLDIDGVFCLGRGVDIDCLENLKSFLRGFNHKVVLSSTRRALDGVCEQVRSLLEEVNVVDKLPLGSSNDKSKLIRQYLDSNLISSYIIIDDNASIYSEKDLEYLILCRSDLGFTTNKKEEAILLATKLNENARD